MDIAVKVPDTTSKVLSLEMTDPTGEIVGSLNLVVLRNFDPQSCIGRHHALIEDVWIDATYRGGGLGDLLINRAIVLAREFECYKITLTTQEPKLVAWYGRFEFKAHSQCLRLDL